MDDSDFPFPKFPVLTDEVKAEARRTQSYMPIGFDFFRATCIASITFACIETRSPVWRQIPPIERNVLRGLLSRWSHLGRSMLQLSHDGDSRETVFIISRALNETSINVRWCLNKDSERRFKLFIEAGVQADLELRNQIFENVKARGSELQIEKRMLKSLDKLAAKSGFVWDDIPLKAKLPDLFQRVKDLGDEHLYRSMQRFPSQSVHGNWSDLAMHYLLEEKGELVPRDKTLRAPDILYLFPALLQLEALMAASQYCFIGEDIQTLFHNYFSEARDDVLTMIQDSGGDEFIAAGSKGDITNG